MNRCLLLRALAGAAVATSWLPVGLASAQRSDGNEIRRSTIAFSSTRDNPPSPTPFVASGEIYLMNADGTDVRRLTNNDSSDIFPSLSPDGTRIVFESNRRRAATDPPNVSDLYLMNTDGSGQTWLGRGSSATWSPDGASIAFHASASGTGLPANPYPGSATLDSDIFVATVRDFLAKKTAPRNLTNNPAAVDDDPDWSPDGQTIIFTSHGVNDHHTNAVTAEVYAISATGAGSPRALTSNKYDDRAPAWSPDGKRILFCCRRGAKPDFDLCVMNADGSGEVKITDDPRGDLTPSWSPDGSRIVFHRGKGRGLGLWDLWVINPDGTGEMRLTDAPGHTGFASWGELRARR